jgi:Ion channel
MKGQIQPQDPTAGVRRILRQYLFGLAISGCNIAIHAMVMLIVIGVARRVGDMTASRPSLQLIGVMITAVLILMIAHFAEVLVWAMSYAIVGAAPEGSDRIYFAFVNYTTLGYGDITPLQRWRLLGPMTAMNGVLLFGWSTAVIFEVLQKVLEMIERGKGRQP